MKFPDNPKRVIAIIEKSSGGDEIGDMWLETRTFKFDSTLKDVLRWALQKGCSGRLILNVDDNTETEIPEFKEKKSETKAVPPADENTIQQDTTPPIPSFEEAEKFADSNSITNGMY